MTVIELHAKGSGPFFRPASAQVGPLLRERPLLVLREVSLPEVTELPFAQGWCLWQCAVDLQAVRW